MHPPDIVEGKTKLVVSGKIALISEFKSYNKLALVKKVPYIGFSPFCHDDDLLLSFTVN